MPVLKSTPIFTNNASSASRTAAGISLFGTSRNLPPGLALRSMTVTAWPWRARSCAAVRPAGPAPTTTTDCLAGAGRSDGRNPSCLIAFLIVLCQESFHFANGGRFIENAAAATLFARMMAKPAQHPRQRQRLAQGGDRFLQAAGLDLPDHRGNIQLQRAKAMAGRKTIADVVAEEQFQRGAAGLVDFLRFAFDDHAGHGLGGAGGDQPALAVGDHLDQADLAGGQRAALFQVAKSWNVDADLPRGLKTVWPGATSTCFPSMVMANVLM